MSFRACALLLVPLLAVSASSKKTPETATGENNDLIITVTMHTDKDEIKELIGDDLGGHYCVAEMKVQPKYGKTVTVDPDDFLLRSSRDNETSRPFAPSQIAGTSAIVVTKTKTTAQTDPNYQDVPMPLGYPGGYGYPDAGIGLGGGGGQIDANKATVKEGDGKETPLEKTLEKKQFTGAKTDQPLTGLLYFAMEKQKLKDLQLEYGPKGNKVVLHFNGKTN
jgi:hypothetical protein